MKLPSAHSAYASDDLFLVTPLADMYRLRVNLSSRNVVGVIARNRQSEIRKEIKAHGFE